MKQKNKEFWQICRNSVLTNILTFLLIGLCLHWTMFEIVLGFVLSTVLSFIIMYFFFCKKRKAEKIKG